MTPIIQLNGADKVYRTPYVETTALNKLSLNIRSGEYVSVVGRSGCGKSTLLSVLGLMTRLSSGEFILDGQNVEQLNDRDRAHLRASKIGFVFQFFHLISELTVSENICLPMQLLKRPSIEIKQRLTELLQLFSLEHRANHYPEQLSGGQQQRVAIARAIVNNPPILLVDEPTGNLDSSSGAKVTELLTQLHQLKHTIVLVTHDETLATQADRCLTMFDGQILTTCEIDHCV